MRRLLCLALLLLTGLTSLALAKSPDKSWPWFRGVDRSGVSKETGLLQEWPSEGPPQVWEAKGAGRGYASFAIVDGRLYTLGDNLSTAEDKDEYLTCFNLEDGKQIWKAKTGPAYNEGQESWQSSRSTPSVDGDRVYCMSPQGILHCCATADGAAIWSKDLRKEFGAGKQGDTEKGDHWGFSESALIDGDRLICTPGKEKNTMVALNKRTGETVWTSSREGDRGAGHASVVISEVGGEKVYVTTTSSGPLGVRASDGKLLWTYPIDQTTAVIPTPIVRGDLVFFTAGYGRGGALLRQVPAGSGEVKIEEIYPLNSEIGNKHGGVVLVGDYLYGDTEDRGIPFCADLMTGKVKWTQRGPGKGSAAIAAADGRLYISFADGTTVLAKAEPEAFVEVGKFQVGDNKRPHWAHPVILDGKLYLRDQDSIYCYDVKAK